MSPRPSRLRQWMRRHPVLTGLWCLNTLVWLLAMLADYDHDLLISLAAFLVLVAVGTLAVLGMGWIIDRFTRYHQPADTPDIASTDPAAAVVFPGPAWQSPADGLTDDDRQFDQELEESEAAQWRRLMRVRHKRVGRVDQAAARSDTVATSGSPVSSATARKADRFCTHCGMPFEANEPFCRQCGARQANS